MKLIKKRSIDGINGKTGIILLIVILLLCIVSCYSSKTIRMETMKSQRTSSFKVLSITKQNGEKIVFPKRNPGRIIGDFIQGFAWSIDDKWTNVKIPFEEIESMELRRFNFRKLIKVSMFVSLIFTPLVVSNFSSGN